MMKNAVEELVAMGLLFVTFFSIFNGCRQAVQWD